MNEIELNNKIELESLNRSIKFKDLELTVLSEEINSEKG